MPSDKPKLLLVIEKELLEKVDDYRFDNRIPSRAEAVRELLRKGLEAETQKPESKK